MKAQSDLLCTRSYTLSSCSFRRTGYVFTGWNMQPDGSGTALANRARVTALSPENGSTVTLYAQWSLTPYRVTYRNVTASDRNPNATSYVYGQSIPLSDLSRDNYEFGGWYSDSSFRNRISAINEDLTGSGNLTIYAKWNQISYNIAFDANALGRGTVRGTMNTMTNRLCGRSYALTGNAFRLDGYTFLGWSTDPYAYVPMYLNRARITNLTTQNGATVTLYAVWQANSLRSSQ